MSLNRVLYEPAAGKSGLSGLLRRPMGGACLFWHRRLFERCIYALN